MGVAVRVTEVTLKKAYNTFTNEHPGVKIGRCSFESLPPKIIRLRPYAQRLQCCCTCHTNMDYIGKAINSLFTKNNKPTLFLIMMYLFLLHFVNRIPLNASYSAVKNV